MLAESTMTMFLADRVERVLPEVEMERKKGEKNQDVTTAGNGGRWRERGLDESNSS